MDSNSNILHFNSGEMFKMKRDLNNPIQPSPSSFAYYEKRWLSQNNGFDLRRLLVSLRPNQEKLQ